MQHLEVHMSDLVSEVRTARRLPPPERARAIRVAAGVSQQRLADELGVHWTTLARWERGERQPRPKQRVAYAELLMRLTMEVGVIEPHAPRPGKVR
jgi:DNA-binding transcriptional regulator YiaG